METKQRKDCGCMGFCSGLDVLGHDFKCALEETSEYGMAKNLYVDACTAQSRAQLLRLCRAGGLTAHKAKTNTALAELLWHCFGRKNWETKRAIIKEAAP